MPIIEELQTLIETRRAEPLPGSYTNRLLADREEAVKKIGEEAVEVIVAALGQSTERLASETADLVYHLLVVLTDRGVPWSSVEAELRQRRK